MKIACLPRTYFEDVRGTALEAELLAANKVVSILSFFLHNRHISPNPYVLRVMKEAAGLSALD